MDFLTGRYDSTTIDALQQLEVYTVDELLNLKEEFKPEDTIYVIGAPTRNRLLGKKLSSNIAFQDYAVFVDSGNPDLLLDYVEALTGIPAIEELQLPELAPDLILPPELTQTPEIKKKPELKDSKKGKKLKSSQPISPLLEPELEIEEIIIQQESEPVKTFFEIPEIDPEPVLAPRLLIRYMSRKNLDIFTTNIDVLTTSPQLEIYKAKVRRYFGLD